MTVLNERSVAIPLDDGQELAADLVTPAPASGIVVFAHGSGSSRLSPRNQRVAAAMHQRGFGTFLFDLLTEREQGVDAIDGRFRFDVRLLADRLLTASSWVRAEQLTARFPLGYFGASTGAAAALIAAARAPDRVRAVVSRGGRPDLAGPFLDRVVAPTLLIVGGRDETVIGMNGDALRQLRGECRLEIVPGATHLFEEPGTLDQVIQLAGDWFSMYLTQADDVGPPHVPA
jgi:putative phosphoribosyl transferase